MAETKKPGYRDTLNLPTTDFPMKANLPEREPERLAWWAERGAYAQLRAARRGAPVWLLHDGPPYSNGHAHMGTAANHVWKDAVVRQASLMGFDSPFVPGWDNHGMPIEVQVSKMMREEKVATDRLALRRRCRAYAAEWVGIQRGEFERLGGWGPLRRVPGVERRARQAGRGARHVPHERDDRQPVAGARGGQRRPDEARRAGDEDLVGHQPAPPGSMRPSTLAARMKSFSDSPPTACVHSVTSTWL